MCSYILPLIPPHSIYCEPFFGGGAVFFAKSPATVEVINDTNCQLMTFYRQVVENFAALQRKIRFTLHAESNYARAKKIFRNAPHESDIDVAWSVWVLANMSFASAMDATSWQWDNLGLNIGKIRHKMDSFTEFLRARLMNVQISCRDALKVIKQRDTQDTFFYIDPPYVGCKQGHYSGYTDTQFTSLLQILASIKGKFILSHYMNDTLREYIGNHAWRSNIVDLPKTVGRSPKRKQEVLVYNYDVQRDLFNPQ